MTTATGFDVLPAIDLRGGRVVRLRQGDFDQATTYESEPAVVAGEFAAAGAQWLHVVDLDGARTGIPAHAEQIAAIVEAVGSQARVEVAGGLRDERAVAVAFEAGAARIIVGTAALRDPAFAGRLVGTYGPGRVVAAIDVRDGRAMGHGWVPSTVGSSGPGSPAAAGPDAVDAISRLADAGVTIFEVTAIERDGLLEGPNLDLYERVVTLGRGSIIASGGVTTLDDIRAVRGLGCTGAIIGRALYEGQLDLAAALRV